MEDCAQNDCGSHAWRLLASNRSFVERVIFTVFWLLKCLQIYSVQFLDMLTFWFAVENLHFGGRHKMGQFEPIWRAGVFHCSGWKLVLSCEFYLSRHQFFTFKSLYKLLSIFLLFLGICPCTFCTGNFAFFYCCKDTEQVYSAGVSVCVGYGWRCLFGLGVGGGGVKTSWGKHVSTCCGNQWWARGIC